MLTKFYQEICNLNDQYNQAIILLKYRLQYVWITLNNFNILTELYLESIAFLIFSGATGNKKVEILKVDAKKITDLNKFLKYEQANTLLSSTSFNELYQLSLIYKNFCEISNISKLIVNPSLKNLINNIPTLDIISALSSKDDYIIVKPLKIRQYLIQSDRQSAAREFKEMLDAQQKLKNQGVNVSILEEISANIGLEVNETWESILEQRNSLKALIKHDPEDINKARLFYTYQIKSLKLMNNLDEEINMVNLVNLILDDEPNSSYYLNEKAWHFLSNSEKIEDSFKITSDLLEKALSMKSEDIKITTMLRLRLASLIWMSDPAKNHLNSKKLWLEAWEATPNNSKVLKVLGLYYTYVEKNYEKGCKCLMKAFDIDNFDEEYYKLMYFLYIQNGQKKQAVKFLKQIYIGIKDQFWINYVLALLYMVRPNFLYFISFIIKRVH